MNIVDVEPLLAHPGAAGGPLRLVRLSALEPSRDAYFALLCQPHGTVHASAARIGNAEPQAVVPMYRALMSDAATFQSQLAITPEYSMPWEVVRQIALEQGAPRPPYGSLWILGCESATPAELETIQLAFADKGVRLLHEPFDVQRRAQTVFVDPLVYVFWATDNAGGNVLCFLVQFKTVGSRDPDHVELQSLYRGTSVYKFTSQVGDVSLIGLVCSDAFEFTNAMVDQHGANLLLVHIQLNQRPGHGDYAAYRSRLFAVASNNNVEILCLNWAARTAIDGVQGPWNSIAGSGWYVAPRGVMPTDAEVNQLHRRGVYYSLVRERWHGFYLNYSPHYVLFRKQPVFAVGPQVLVQRPAPQVVERRAWDLPQGQWTDVRADDGFDTFIQQYDPLGTTLPQICAQDPLAVERALELLEGPQGNVSHWYRLNELRALHVAEEESIRRVTVSQETDVMRQGVALRRRRMRCAQTAATVPGQAVTWPIPVADLAGGFRYRWTEEEPHCNVEPLAGGRPAAFVYLGEDPETDTLANVYAKLTKARRMHAYGVCVQAGVDHADAVGLAEDRLCVVYKANHQLRFYRPTGFASIVDPSETIEDDIAGEKQ